VDETLVAAAAAARRGRSEQSRYGGVHGPCSSVAAGMILSLRARDRGRAAGGGGGGGDASFVDQSNYLSR